MLRKRYLTIIGAAFALITGCISKLPVSSETDAQLRSGARTHDDGSSPPAASCSSLKGLKVDSGIVEDADKVTAGEQFVGGAMNGIEAAVDLCRVRIRLAPVAGSQINVEVWLPGTWNTKLLGLGGGGFDGSLSAGAAAPLSKAVTQGYAAVVTDVGHAAGASAETWVHKQPERIVDFGHRGQHLAAVVSKQVIAAYYGEAAQRAYFIGCSNGGRDGIMLASRYPEDYDGVVAGAPALRYVEIVTQLVSYSQAVGGLPNLSSKRQLVHDAIMKKCDKLDGVQDGVLENPRLCRFDPAALQCSDGAGKACLSAAEVGAFRKIYAGPRLAGGEQILSGPALGSEGVPDNWTAWITGPVPAIAGQEFYRWMVYDDPEWNVKNFMLDRDYPVAREHLASIINADNPDLRAFVRRGGKLIIYQGWNDPAITPDSTIAYYEDVRRVLGAEAANHVRLYMVPGMTHCAGGPGATSFDMQGVLEKWIEGGEMPERVVASRPADHEPPFTRPLCPWPKTAHYDGSGSTRDAANFVCKPPRRSGVRLAEDI